MSDTVQAAWIDAAAPLLGAVVVTVLVVILVVRNWDGLAHLLGRASRLKVGMLELELATKSLQTSAERRVEVAVSERLRDRAERLRPAVTGMRVLWVDDKPLGNRAERAFLRAAGAEVLNVVSTQEAVTALGRDDWDVVITNVRRGDDATAGLDLARSAAEQGTGVPFVGYVMNLEPGVPAGFVAMTNRPEELIGAVLDLADRRG